MLTRCRLHWRNENIVDATRWTVMSLLYLSSPFATLLFLSRAIHIWCFDGNWCACDVFLVACDNFVDIWVTILLVFVGGDWCACDLMFGWRFWILLVAIVFLVIVVVVLKMKKVGYWRWQRWWYGDASGGSEVEMLLVGAIVDWDWVG